MRARISWKARSIAGCRRSTRIPGGLPVRDVMTNHRPEPKEHPGLVVVGDYLFDSTLNGLLDSSDAATDIIVTEMMRLRHARAQSGEPPSDKIDRDYFENYRGVGPYSEVWSQFTDPAYLMDLIKIVWGGAQGLQAAGRGLGERRIGRRAARTRHRCLGHREQQVHPRQDAEGAAKVQQARLDRRNAVQGRRNSISSSRPACVMSPKNRSARAVRELNRVVKTGLVFGSVTQRHGAGADRPLRPVARRQEARHLVGVVGIVFRQRLRPVDASQATAPMRCGRRRWRPTRDRATGTPTPTVCVIRFSTRSNED